MRVEIFDRMEQCTAEEVERMLPMVSAQRREQALRYTHTFGRFCCLKSWLMVKEMMDNGRWTMDNGRWTMDKGQWTMDRWLYNEHGKPYIEGGPHFSISHCKAGIAVAVDDQPIGIDIETIRHADDELAARVMNEQEQAAMSDERFGDRDRVFTRLWTQKEAVVKAQGVGIMSFEQLQRTLDNGQWTIESFETEKTIYSIAHK